MQADLRDGIALFSTNDHQRRNDGESERQTETNDRSFTRLRLNVDGSADALGGSLHHVHSHSATGEIGNLLCSREARLKEKVDDLSIGENLGLVPTQKTALDSPFSDSRQIDATTVVDELDSDLATFVKRSDMNGTVIGFAQSSPVRRSLQSVVDGVSKNVGERILDGFQSRI